MSTTRGRERGCRDHGSHVEEEAEMRAPDARLLSPPADVVLE
jgi:hypothetical protein